MHRHSTHNRCKFFSPSKSTPNNKKKLFFDLINFGSFRLQDVEEKVQKTFPTPIDKVSEKLMHNFTSNFNHLKLQWALTDARNTIDKSKRKKPVLPVDRMHTLLQKVSKIRRSFQVSSHEIISQWWFTSQLAQPLIYDLRYSIYFLGSVAIQNRQLCELISRGSSRVHLCGHFEVGWKLCEEHEALRDNAGRCTNRYSCW